MKNFLKQNIVRIIFILIFIILFIINFLEIIPFGKTNNLFLFILLCDLIIFIGLARKYKRNIFYLFFLLSAVCITIFYLNYPKSENLELLKFVFWGLAIYFSPLIKKKQKLTTK